MTASRTVATASTGNNDALRQLQDDVPGTTDLYLPDRRRYRLLTTTDARSPLKISSDQVVKADAFILYQIVDERNGRTSARFVGWASQATVQGAMRKRQTTVTVPYKVLGDLEALRVPVIRATVERRVVTERGFDGNSYTYTWGWADKSVQVKRNDVVLDLFYEGNGAAYSFFTGQKFKSLAAAIDSVKAPAAMIQPTIIDRTRSWEIDHKKQAKQAPKRARTQAQTARYQPQARVRKDWE